MGRQGGYPRYMQPTESSILRGGGKPTQRDVKTKPKRAVAKPRIVKKMEDLGNRSVKKISSKPSESKCIVEKKLPSLGRTSIPKAPPPRPVELKKPVLSVANRTKPGPVTSLKKAAAKVIPAKMRGARMDMSLKAVEKIRTFTSKLPTFSKTASSQSKIKPPTIRSLPKKASKIPKAPKTTPMHESTNSRVDKPPVMSRAERRHYKVWEGMTKANQQVFGFRGISKLAAIRC